MTIEHFQLEIMMSAKQFHDLIEKRLQEQGFATQREALAPYRDNLRGERPQGRIDLLATKNSYAVALELDYLSPRQRSIAKLSAFPADEAWVLCRNGVKLRVK